MSEEPFGFDIDAAGGAAPAAPARVAVETADVTVGVARILSLLDHGIGDRAVTWRPGAGFDVGDQAIRATPPLFSYLSWLWRRYHKVPTNIADRAAADALVAAQRAWTAPGAEPAQGLPHTAAPAGAAAAIPVLPGRHRCGTECEGGADKGCVTPARPSCGTHWRRGEVRC